MKPHLPPLCLASIVTAAGGGVAWAQDDDGLHISLGVAGAYRPEYKGSKDYEAAPPPFVGFRYGRGDFYVSLEGPAPRAGILPGGGLGLVAKST